MLKIYVEKSSSVKRKKKIGDHPRWTFHKFSARGHPSPLWSCTKGCPCIVIIHWRFLDPVAAWRLTEERFEFEITIIDYKLSEFIKSRDDSIDKSFHFFYINRIVRKIIRIYWLRGTCCERLEIGCLTLNYRAWKYNYMVILVA